MIKEEDNELTTKININSIYSYGSNEKIILKQNEYLNQLIKFYKKQIEINKEKLVYYFKQDKDKIKENYLLLIFHFLFLIFLYLIINFDLSIYFLYLISQFLFYIYY